MLRRMLFGDVAELVAVTEAATAAAAAPKYAILSATSMPSIFAIECGVGRLGGRA